MLDAFLFGKTECEFTNGLITSFSPYPEGCRWVKAEIREAIFEDLYVSFILVPNMGKYFSFSWHKSLVTTTDFRLHYSDLKNSLFSSSFIFVGFC